jgi:hypothetical protein
MRALTCTAVLAAALAAAGAAAAVGPWPGLARSVADPARDLRYTAARGGDATTVGAVRDGKVVRSATVAGAFGIPAVTSGGLAAGLSPDGRLLVLAQPRGLRPRQRSTFLVLSTARLAVQARIVLSGEVGFDALSPDGRTLYLIEHASRSDPTRYVVRAYDLRQRRLLPGAIVDKRNVDEVMSGYPVARAESARGRWVYTLYRRAGREAFVHALDTAGRRAFCIDFEWRGGDRELWGARLRLADGDRRLVVRSDGENVVTIDTRTLRVR